ncbi:MAG: transporter [Paracoccaceae bacterium]
MNRFLKHKFILFSAIFLGLGISGGTAEEAHSDLANQLSNPISSLISVPFQLNHDSGYGPNGDGTKTFVNIQPVIPFSISDDWNLISRTIIPFVVEQKDVIPGTSQAGVGDIVQSFFFSPKRSTASGVTWGVGPVLLLPTATDKALGGGKWGAGLTGVVLRQANGWTYGGLANHIWSIGGDTSRNDISATFVQPFLSYSTAKAWSYTINSEATYDWKASDWSIPINLIVGKVVNFGKQPVQLSGGIRYWANSAQNGPSGLGVRMQMTFLFPK